MPITLDGTANTFNGIVPSDGGLTLLGTLNTTSGNSQTLSGLTLTGYKQVLAVLIGVQAGGNITCGGITASSTGGATQTARSFILFDLASATGAPFTGGNATSGASTVTNASTSITVSGSGLAAGSVTFYGVK